MNPSHEARLQLMLIALRLGMDPDEVAGWPDHDGRTTLSDSSIPPPPGDDSDTVCDT